MQSESAHASISKGRTDHLRLYSRKSTDGEHGQQPLPKKLAHDENTPIQIYRKFRHQKLKDFR